MATLQMNILSFTWGMQANFCVFLPSLVPTKDNAKETYEEIYPRDVRFKTLWLIGSEYGDDSEFLRNSGIARYAQEHNLAVVMPCTNNKLYSEDPKGQKFIRHITEELWTVATCSLAISDKREDNYIGGVSLGAYAALKAALLNPEKYSKVVLFEGAFEEDLKETYLKDFNEGLAEKGVSIHVGLDDALPDDAELFDKGKALAESGAPLPEISVSYRGSGELSAYAARAAQNLRELGFAVREKKYEVDDLWEFCDQALKTELNEFVCAE